MAQPGRPPICLCGKPCMMDCGWEGANVGRRYWCCMNKLYKQPDEPTCEFDEWAEEPCYQESYRERLQDFHNMWLYQQRIQKEGDRIITEMREKLKEVEDKKWRAEWNCEAHKERNEKYKRELAEVKARVKELEEEKEQMEERFKWLERRINDN